MKEKEKVITQNSLEVEFWLYKIEINMGYQYLNDRLHNKINK